MTRRIFTSVPIVFFILCLSVLAGPARSHAATVFTSIGVGPGANPTYLTATSTMLYVSNPGTNSITAINTITNATSTISLSSAPSFIKALGKYIFAGSSQHNFYAIDTSNNNSVTTMGTSGNPVGGLAAIGTRMFYSIPALNMVLFSDTANSLTGVGIPVGAGPQGIAASSTMLYVANTASSSVSMIDTANSFTTTTVGLGASAVSPMNVLPLGTKLYVTDEGTNLVSVVDLANGNATSTITVGSNPTVMTAIGSKIYVVNSGDSFISVIDTANGNSVSNLLTDYVAQDVTAIGTTLYVASPSTGFVLAVDTANGNATTMINTGAGTEHFAYMNNNLYVTADDNAVHGIDTNTTAATLTEITPVPSVPTNNSVTYTFSSSYVNGEQESLYIGSGCTSGLQTSATPVISNTTSTVTISGLQSGTTYSCTAYLIDRNGNQSNTLTIGPFTWTQASTPAVTTIGGSVSGGTSVTQQVANLEAMGNTALAQSIESKWPSLFGTSASSLTPTVTISDTASSTAAGVAYPFTRDLERGMSGSDVTALQQFLIAKGTGPAAQALGVGGTTTYFGSLTKAALIEYQKANDISPSAGYFGPLTRAYIAAHQ